jgi:hypothetical protein
MPTSVVQIFSEEGTLVGKINYNNNNIIKSVRTLQYRRRKHEPQCFKLLQNKRKLELAARNKAARMSTTLSEKKTHQAPLGDKAGNDPPGVPSLSIKRARKG